MNRVGVMQITDTLAAGGLERVAVNLANSLPKEIYRSYICSTRQGGRLEDELLQHVIQIELNRRGRFDFAAVCKLVAYISKQSIQILHAHGTSLFIAAIASLLKKNVRLIWHDHFGCFETDNRAPVYRVAAKAVDGIISVTEPLARWAEQELRVEKIWYVPNFSTPSSGNERFYCELPGAKGSRVVCVANLRPQKDHLNLLHAFAMVVAQFPEAHLIMVGAVVDCACHAAMESLIAHLQIGRNVSWLGSCSNVQAILQNCDIGVLSSVSEGLPLALLEYGMAGLPPIVTNVGQCAEVLDHGTAGILVPSSSPAALAHALQLLLRSPEARKSLGKKFKQRVQKNYSSAAAIKKICGIYETILLGTKIA